MVATVDEGTALFAAGFNMIMYSADIRLLQTALAAGVEALKAKCTSTSV